MYSYNIRGPSIGAPPMKLMDLIESDELGDLDVEFLNNELSYMPCRDFKKGFCEQGQFCKYYHRYRLGVYSFCHKFQYSTCSVLHCKFIHATPYEQQLYYRTGKFDTCRLQHLNKRTSCLTLVAGSSLAHLSRNPYPKHQLPDATYSPVSTSRRPIPVDIADIPLPETSPVVADIPLPVTPPRATKRPWFAMEEATNSSGDSIKRCVCCE